MPKNSSPRHKSKPGRQAQDELQAWLDAVPVGREFGSPDFERLTELDHAAFTAFQSWEKVRQWLAHPHHLFDGECPEDLARSTDGFKKVMAFLVTVGGKVDLDLMKDKKTDPVQERDSIQDLGDFKNLQGMFGKASKRVAIADMNTVVARRGATKK